MVLERITCNECGHEFADLEVDSPCPACGCQVRRVDIAVHDTVSLALKELVRLKAREVGKKDPVRELVAGDELSWKTGKWMEKQRVIDRRANRYTEKVVDSETGEIVHECNEPLSEHRDRGSARRHQR